MIATVSLFALLGAQQAVQYERDPNVVVNSMFKKYAYAKSLSGTIVQTTTDGAGTLKITTLVDYVRPSKIRVLQDYVGKNGLKLSLVSDGVKFAYDPPRSILKPKPYERLIEPVVIEQTVSNRRLELNVGQIYHAAHVSLMPSTLLDLAVAHRQHLSDFMINVASIRMVGVETVGEKKAYHIAGAWQPYIGAASTGVYDIWISPEFDLLRFALVEKFKVGGQLVNVTTVEAADLKIDVPVAEDRFVVK